MSAHLYPYTLYFHDPGSTCLVVAPVVNTSSTINTCFPIKRFSMMQFEDSPPTFSQRSKIDLRVCVSVYFRRTTASVSTGDSSHGSNSPRYPFTLIIATDAVVCVSCSGIGIITSIPLERNRLYQFRSHVSSHDGSLSLSTPHIISKCSIRRKSLPFPIVEKDVARSKGNFPE